MEDVFLSLGANLGNPYTTLLKALELIGNIENVRGVKTSSFYKTSPVGSITQNDFLNIACHIQTSLKPENLLMKLQKIEKELGKVPKEKQQPRLVDIDILFYGKKHININGLIIPHLEWKNRLFVLIPLNELTSSITLTDGNTLELKSLIDDFSSIQPQKIDLYNPKESAYEESLYC